MEAMSAPILPGRQGNPLEAQVAWYEFAFRCICLVFRSESIHMAWYFSSCHLGVLGMSLVHEKAHTSCSHRVLLEQRCSESLLEFGTDF